MLANFVHIPKDTPFSTVILVLLAHIAAIGIFMWWTSRKKYLNNLNESVLIQSFSYNTGNQNITTKYHINDMDVVIDITADHDKKDNLVLLLNTIDNLLKNYKYECSN